MRIKKQKKLAHINRNTKLPEIKGRKAQTAAGQCVDYEDARVSSFNTMTRILIKAARMDGILNGFLLISPQRAVRVQRMHFGSSLFSMLAPFNASGLS